MRVRGPSAQPTIAEPALPPAPGGAPAISVGPAGRPTESPPSDRGAVRRAVADHLGAIDPEAARAAGLALTGRCRALAAKLEAAAQPPARGQGAPVGHAVEAFTRARRAVPEANLAAHLFPGELAALGASIALLLERAERRRDDPAVAPLLGLRDPSAWDPALVEALRRLAPTRHPWFDGERLGEVAVYAADAQIPAGSGEASDVLRRAATEQTRALREMARTTRSPRTALGGDGLAWAIGATPREVGLRFQAHGLAKSPLEGLDRLLRGGVDPGRELWTMAFIDESAGANGFGADHPKTEGGLIVVGAPDERIQASGIAMVIVGEEHLGSLDLLRAAYPDAKFVPWHDAPAALMGAAAHHDGQRFDPRTAPRIGPDNPLHYARARPEAPRPVEVPESAPLGGGSHDVW